MKTDEYGNPTIRFDALTTDTPNPVEAYKFNDGVVQIRVGHDFGSLTSVQALEFARWIEDVVGSTASGHDRKDNRYAGTH